MEMDHNGIEINWDGHSSVRFVDNGFTVAADPYSEVSPEFEADIVLVTHRDEGHFDPEMLEKVCEDRTCLVVPESMNGLELPCMDVEYIEEGEVVDIYGVEIEAVPMYNDSHDKGEGLGYRIVMDGNAFYIAGDTGLIEEVDDLENRVDVAFLPVDGVFTMDFKEAVKMSVRIRPEVVVPYHYGPPFFEGVNPQSLKAELEDRSIRCEILESES